MFARLIFAFVCTAVLAAAPVRAQEQPAEPVPVDLRLVLAIDSSSSVQMSQYYLQLQGYAAAFRHPDVLAAVRSGPNQAIAVALFEWSGARQQQINLGWRILRDEDDLRHYADELAVAPRLVTGGETAIGAAINYALRLLDDDDTTAPRLVIDVSGDGANNQEPPVTAARDAAADRGITVNGLAVLHKEPDLADHYRRNVIAGADAFVITATTYADFADAMLRKLVREIKVAQARSQ